MKSLKTLLEEQAYRPAPDERPSVTVDIVLFTISEGELKLLLIKRRDEPFKAMWAIPGGFVRKGETLDQAALRELREETNVSGVYLEQLYTFGDPERDPRTWVITVAYFALVNSVNLQIKAETDAIDASWHSINNLPTLAFDHRKIVDYAVWRLRNKLEYTTVGFQLLPEKFTLTELQRVYEIILDKTLDKRNFRKKILSLSILKELNETKMDGIHRPAKLYTFVEKL
ncbi:MAG: NUDIX hydrolase [Blastocatellia bacterium]|nr:NUDIX hydrolase [Blastocatellia bacterium]